MRLPEPLLRTNCLDYIIWDCSINNETSYLEVEIIQEATVLDRLASSGPMPKHFSSKLSTTAKRDLFSCKCNYGEPRFFVIN